jgi:hypothetical protein
MDRRAQMGSSSVSLSCAYKLIAARGACVPRPNWTGLKQLMTAPAMSKLEALPMRIDQTIEDPSRASTELWKLVEALRRKIATLEHQL